MKPSRSNQHLKQSTIFSQVAPILNLPLSCSISTYGSYQMHLQLKIIKIRYYNGYSYYSVQTIITISN